MNELALAPLEVLVYKPSLRLANALTNDLLGQERGHPPELVRDLAVRAEIGRSDLNEHRIPEPVTRRRRIALRDLGEGIRDLLDDRLGRKDAEVTVRLELGPNLHIGPVMLSEGLGHGLFDRFGEQGDVDPLLRDKLIHGVTKRRRDETRLSHEIRDTPPIITRYLLVLIKIRVPSDRTDQRKRAAPSDATLLRKPYEIGRIMRRSPGERQGLFSRQKANGGQAPSPVP